MGTPRWGARSGGGGALASREDHGAPRGAAGGDGGRRSPELLTAQFYTRFSVPIEPVSSWCLISHSQYKLGGEALHNNLEDKEVSHTNLAESPKCGLSQRRWS